MKYQKIITGASLVGLLTFLLPVVTSGGYSIAPMNERIGDYLGTSFVFVSILWYGAFVVTLLLSLVGSDKVVLNKIKLVVIAFLNVYAIFIHAIILERLLGNGSMGIGAILYYLSAIVNIFATIMLFKKSSLNINKEDLMKIAEKGLDISKSAAKVTVKVAKTAVEEVKKEIDKEK